MENKLPPSDVDISKLRKPLIIYGTAIILKCVFPKEEEISVHLSNKIDSNFNLDAAIKEAKELHCYDSFVEWRSLANYIETQIQTLHKLHFPLKPPMSFEHGGNYWQVRSIDYVSHPESKVLIANLKTYLV